MPTVIIKGSYSTNHPKDRMARRYTELKSFIRERQCTTSEMQRPTEENVQKCMKEMQYTTKATKELKRIGRTLGEQTNCESFRRRA